MKIETFLPTSDCVRYWHDRKKIIVKPLFPSYVFVKPISAIEFHKALSINGVYGYVKFGKEYATISEQEIRKVKFITGTDDITDVEINTSIPEVGKLHKISFGIWSGIECEVLRMGGKNKVVVRINSIDQNIIATLPSKMLLEPKFI